MAQTSPLDTFYKAFRTATHPSTDNATALNACRMMPGILGRKGYEITDLTPFSSDFLILSYRKRISDGDAEISRLQETVEKRQRKIDALKTRRLRTVKLALGLRGEVSRLRRQVVDLRNEAERRASEIAAVSPVVLPSPEAPAEILATPLPLTVSEPETQAVPAAEEGSATYAEMAALVQPIFGTTFGWKGHFSKHTGFPAQTTWLWQKKDCVPASAMASIRAFVDRVNKGEVVIESVDAKYCTYQDLLDVIGLIFGNKIGRIKETAEFLGVSTTMTSYWFKKGIVPLRHLTTLMSHPSYPGNSTEAVIAEDVEVTLDVGADTAKASKISEAKPKISRAEFEAEGQRLSGNRLDWRNLFLQETGRKLNARWVTKEVMDELRAFEWDKYAPIEVPYAEFKEWLDIVYADSRFPLMDFCNDTGNRYTRQNLNWWRECGRVPAQAMEFFEKLTAAAA